MVQSVKSIKPKTCKVCKDRFTPFRVGQFVCSHECAFNYALKQRVKSEQKDYLATKKIIKTRGQWIREAQSAVNSYIRERDRDLPCISCQRYHIGQYHAGHYRPTSTNPEIRFNELNLHKQCSACNNHLHGNLVNYRINLINKIGLDKVEWLESNHEPAKYTIDELKAIKEEYRLKLKTLKSII